MSSEGIFCSTAGSVFTDKQAFTQHYKSDFHLYNLKRRVAGLPPVTRELFEERKSQILAEAAKKPKQQVWTEPLTKKKFQSEATYNAFIQSKKYKTLLRQANLTEPPKPYTTEKQTKNGGNTQADDVRDLADSGNWDVTVSLFDNHKSDSMESNLEYMFKRFGFYLPNSEFLTDAEGLLQYLGAKLGQGHIPLYCSGLDPRAKQFTSLHAVQNHMLDIHKCTMLFDDNEEEYVDFYDLDALFETETGAELSLGIDPEELSGVEIVVRNEDGQSKILGNREFAYLYRQRHRRFDDRDSVMAGRLVAKYQSLGIKTRELIPEEVKRSRKKEVNRRSWTRMKTDLRSNVNRNLPRNVPY